MVGRARLRVHRCARSCDSRACAVRDPSRPGRTVTALLVGVGGAAGALARFGIGKLVSTDALPWATVGINVVGSLLLGMLVAAGDWFSTEVRVALAVGVLGGFTTFST